MFENESNKIREDIVLLRQLMDADEEDNEAWDIYQTERKLNIVMDHIEFLQRNLPYDQITDDIEDEVVECDRLIEITTDLVEQCKYKYYLNNSFFRYHVIPEFVSKIEDKPQKKRYTSGELAETFVITLVILVILAGLVYQCL